MVYVQNIDGNPLMPTTRFGKVRRMLKDGLAKVVRREPFVIRLNYETTEHTQPISLGVDAGIAHIGLSATTTNKELYAAELQPRTDIIGLIAERKDYRHSRRVRKLRHRKIRQNNRKKKEGWIPPSTKHCVDTHLRIIKEIYAILPVSSLTIEIGQFDLRKIQDPGVSGLDYQRGEMFGFWNVREYVFFRDQHTCLHCKGKSKDKILNVHHLESRRVGGDSPSNLITLCETCHKAFHQGKFDLDIKRAPSLRGAGTISVMRWELYRQAKSLYSNIHITHGFTTKNTRIRCGLKKSHIVDARCISGNPTSNAAANFYFIKQMRRHNRKIHKYNPIKGGLRKLNQAPYIVKGFRLFDKVVYEGENCFIFGRRRRGYFDLRKLNGEKVHPCAKSEKLHLLSRAKRFLIETKKAEEHL